MVTTRRQLLRGAALSGVGVLAGCTGGGDGGDGGGGDGGDGGGGDGGDGGGDGGDGGGQSSYQIKIQAASEGSTYYALSAPLGETLTEYSEDPTVTPTVSTTGGGVQNVRVVGQGNATMGMAVSAPLFLGYHGRGPFDQAWDNVRTIVRADSYPIFHIVKEGSDIESISDLEGTRGSAGPSGSGALSIHQGIMDILDIDVDRVKLQHGEGSQALQDGDIDWWWFVMSPFMTRAFSSFDVRPLGFTSDQMDQIIEGRPWHGRLTLDSSWIDQVEGEYRNPGVNPMWFTHDGADNALVSEILEVLFDHPDAVTEARTNPSPLTKEFGHYTEGFDVPYHEAADSFFSG